MNQSIALQIALTVNALLTVGIVILWLRSRVQIKSLTKRVEAMGGSEALRGRDFPTIAESGKKRLITVELLNPMELAANESWFARQFGSLTPALVHKLVYDQARQKVIEKMPEFGAKADVKIHVR